ncbi:MAG TPA: hypothetical protein VK907_07755, partial [Phnomibacter sp.]|nr:hypothetical protein [Phnomibacter sp.]
MYIFSRYFTLIMLLFAGFMGHGQKKISPQAIAGGPWVLHRDTVNAFEVEVPAPLIYDPSLARQTNIPPGWKVHPYALVDKTSGIFLLVTITTPGNDLFIFNDSIYLESLRQNQSKNLVNRTLDTILMDGDRFYYLQEGKAANNNAYLRSKAIVRGNRVITLVAGYEKGKENHPVIAHFMNSFRFIDYLPATFKQYNFAHGAFSAIGPAPFMFHIDSVSAEYPIVTYNSRDTFSADVYSTVVVPASNKQWYRNAGEYWGEKLALMTDAEDSLVHQEPVTNGEAEGYQVKLLSKRLMKHVRMLPFADSLVILVTVTPPGEELHGRKKEFFETFRFAGPYREPVIFRSRAVELLSDLLATDSVVYQDALARMADAPFAIADIPILRKALLQHYPLSVYSTRYAQTPTEKISDALLALGDPSLSSFVMREYEQPNERNWTEQSLLLNLMARDPKQETFG